MKKGTIGLMDFSLCSTQASVEFSMAQSINRPTKLWKLLDIPAPYSCCQGFWRDFSVAKKEHWLLF